MTWTRLGFTYGKISGQLTDALSLDRFAVSPGTGDKDEL